MPSLSRAYIRLAFCYLLIGVTLGGILLTAKGVAPRAPVWWLLPLHIETLLLGWLLHLVMGTAFWIAPRFWTSPRRGDVRGAYLAIVLLNLGIWLVIWDSLYRGVIWLAPLGRGAEGLAAVAFLHHLWPRIVSRDG